MCAGFFSFLNGLLGGGLNNKKSVFIWGRRAGPQGLHPQKYVPGEDGSYLTVEIV